MYPILFQIGSLEIHSYTGFMDIGIALGAVWFLRKGKPFDGFVFFGYLILHGLVRFGVEALRDGSVYLLELKVAQLVALSEVALGALLMAYFWLLLKQSTSRDRNSAR